MLYSRINQPDTYRPLLTGTIWNEVFSWIADFDPTLPDGIHPIRGEEIFVNLHRYETLHRKDCRWESHRRYIDLQYCLEGEETIDVTDRALLTDDGAYQEDADLLFHHDFESSIQRNTETPHFVSLPMSSGGFAIFTPSDAHRPKVRPALRPTPVRKFVVKIAISLLENEG